MHGPEDPTIDARANPRALGVPDAGGDAFWHRLRVAASAPYRQADRFAWLFARGKLGRDPVFRHLLEAGLLPPRARVLDVGCGQGLLASLLAACGRANTPWPAHWGRAPQSSSYLGIELMARDVVRGRVALRTLAPAVQLLCADMRRIDLPVCDVVVILDVLHYVDHAEQTRLLEKARDALPVQGRLLLRVGDAARRRRHAFSQWVDRAVTRLRGHHVAPVWCRGLPEWTQLLERLGFQVQAQPMSRGTPFANVLLVCQRRGGDT